MSLLRKTRLLICAGLCLLLLAANVAHARDGIRFASISWTGVTVKTEMGVSVLQSLGYEAENYMLSVPVAYKAMATGEADIFLGNWMPSMKTIAESYFADGTVVKSIANMEGAQYTLAAPSYVLDGGLKSFADIAKYGEKLDYKIYGIEEGNDGNEVILSMIKQNMFGLGKFELIPSSEAGMLGQVQDKIHNNEWIVFLGWTPHYMNEIMSIGYLTGSTADTFGADDGLATIYTNYRAGFEKEQPNVITFLENLKFPLAMMNQIMTSLHKDSHLTPRKAGLDWIKKHPEVYKGWLKGVTTKDGKPALAAWEKWLKAN